MSQGDLSSVDAMLRGTGRRVLSEFPGAESVLLRLRDRYARAYIGVRTVANRLRYEAAPRPYKLIEVDPAAIEFVNPVEGPKYRHSGEVAGGTWDLTTERFEEMDVFEAYRAHFVEGVSWSETKFFERIVAEIENGATPWGCSTPTEFRERCDRLDRLYETIRDEGYRSQRELLEAGTTNPIKAPHPLKIERYKDEIAVNIDRNGEIQFSDGRNRLSMAKLLDLDTVPVRVLRRHAEWQSVRDRTALGESVPEHLQDHPDLRAIRAETGGD